MKKKDLLSQTRAALLEIAAELNVRGRTRMNKTELARAIMDAETSAPVEAQDEGPPPGRERRRKPVREKDLIRRSWREQQSAVQHSKFEAKAATAPEPPAAPVKRPAPARLKESPLPRAEDRIVLMVRDPYWIFVYWDISQQSLREAKVSFGEEWGGVSMILRVYDVTGIDFDGGNSHSHFDVSIGDGANNWYINTQAPARSFLVDIGLLSPSGRFVLLARSNAVTTPASSPSGIEDEEYMIPDWEFDKIYALSGGFTFDSGSGSIELKELIEKALGAEIGSGAPGSMGVTSPGVAAEKGRGFWFRVGTELIVYGATEADAKVTVQGREVPLRPDGTFSLRFALPDGFQVIPATAESADGIDRITITSTVEKSTERED
ncbi:MAG: DUF4912 domain-containing protein [bacterium]|jgi:hypothetical protein